MFDVQDDTQTRTLQIAGGRWVVIQAPVSLGWNGAKLAQFASGVQVLVTRAAKPRLSPGPAGWRQPAVGPGRLKPRQAPIAQRIERLPPKQ